GPVGHGPLEVYRNHEQALVAAGLKKKFECATGCSDLFFAWSNGLDMVGGFRWTPNSGVPTADGKSSFPLNAALTYEDGRFLYGVLSRGGKDVHVLLYTGVAAVRATERSTIFLEFVEPKAMPTGQVTVDAGAMEKGLAAEGKIALYGVYFDTGKAELK